MSDYVVKVENLNVWYGKPSFFGSSHRVQILHDVSFELKRGEILGLVGESGCGKSTLARTILGIEKDKTGTIEHKTFRPQMVFQNPYGSLNPYKKVGWIIEEPLRVLKKKNQEENVGILYISHDLSLVRRLCTRVIVMYRGNIVETGDVDQVFNHPREEYTQRLIAAIPTRKKRYV